MAFVGFGVADALSKQMSWSSDRLKELLDLEFYVCVCLWRKIICGVTLVRTLEEPSVQISVLSIAQYNAWAS